ncbi:MAG TPA: ATP-binding protein [Phycisphaerales bacterium]
MIGSIWFILGLFLGAALASLSSALLLKRHLRRSKVAERRARSAERLAELGAMTGGLAHEIKNPLSTVGLNAQLLGESIEELPIAGDEKGRLVRRVQSLRREVERLRGILTDFLQFAGELRLDRREADLNTAVGELIDFFAPQAEKSGVRLRSDLHAEPLRASVDVSHFKQAVLNLMLNATQAMTLNPDNPGDASRPRELIIKTMVARDPDQRRTAQVHVIDTGPGIAPDVLPRIFTPYFTTKSGGTGLGLPTSRRLIEAHEGRLEVISEPGRGTDFVITLPLIAS